MSDPDLNSKFTTTKMCLQLKFWLNLKYLDFSPFFPDPDPFVKVQSCFRFFCERVRLGSGFVTTESELDPVPFLDGGIRIRPSGPGTHQQNHPGEQRLAVQINKFLPCCFSSLYIMNEKKFRTLVHFSAEWTWGIITA